MSLGGSCCDEKIVHNKSIDFAEKAFKLMEYTEKKENQAIYQISHFIKGIHFQFPLAS